MDAKLDADKLMKLHRKRINNIKIKTVKFSNAVIILSVLSILPKYALLLSKTRKNDQNLTRTM